MVHLSSELELQQDLNVSQLRRTVSAVHRRSTYNRRLERIITGEINVRLVRSCLVRGSVLYVLERRVNKAVLRLTFPPDSQDLSSLQTSVSHSLRPLQHRYV
jgi:hypothetical protein